MGLGDTTLRGPPGKLPRGVWGARRLGRPAVEGVLREGDSRPDAPGLTGVRKPPGFPAPAGESDLGGASEGGG